MFFWACVACVIVPLMAEYRLVQRWRARVPVRIHVHGSRGKTSTTKALAARLRALGFRVLAKTTGDAPEYVLPDGRLCPVTRFGPARIQEHLSLLRRAAGMHANVVVVEGMALQPETVAVSEDMLQATHMIITNVRPDHEETMGKGRAGVINTLSLAIPPGGMLFTGEEAGARALARHAHHKGATCCIVPSLHHGAPETLRCLYQPSELANAVLQSLALGAKVPLDLLSPVQECCFVGPHGVSVCFIDLFSCNDVCSTRLLLQNMAPATDGCMTMALVHTRADRPLRTRAFVRWLRCATTFDCLVVSGSHVYFVWLVWNAGRIWNLGRALLFRGRIGYVLQRYKPEQPEQPEQAGQPEQPGQAGKHIRGVPLLVCPPWVKPQVMLERLARYAVKNGCSKLVLVGMGNAHGHAQGWRACCGEKTC